MMASGSARWGALTHKTAGLIGRREENPLQPPAPIQRGGANAPPAISRPLDVAMDLDALSGGARILKAYAAALGYDLVLNEKGVRVECTLRHIGEVGKASGNLHAAMCEAAADGKITPHEAERIERKATILDDATDLLRGDMRRIRAVE